MEKFLGIIRGTGLVLIALGVISIAVGWLYRPEWGPQANLFVIMMVTGSVPLVLGVAFVIVAFIARRTAGRKKARR